MVPKTTFETSEWDETPLEILLSEGDNRRRKRAPARRVALDLKSINRDAAYRRKCSAAFSRLISFYPDCVTAFFYQSVLPFIYGNKSKEIRQAKAKQTPNEKFTVARQTKRQKLTNQAVRVADEAPIDPASLNDVRIMLGVQGHLHDAVDNSRSGSRAILDKWEKLLESVAISRRTDVPLHKRKQKMMNSRNVDSKGKTLQTKDDRIRIIDDLYNGMDVEFPHEVVNVRAKYDKVTYEDGTPKVYKNQPVFIMSSGSRLQRDSAVGDIDFFKAFGITLVTPDNNVEYEGQVDDQDGEPINNVWAAANYCIYTWCGDQESQSIAATFGVVIDRDLKGEKVPLNEDGKPIRCWRFIHRNAAGYEGQMGFLGAYIESLNRGLVPPFDVRKISIPANLINKFISFYDAGPEERRTIEIELRRAGIEPNPGPMRGRSKVTSPDCMPCVAGILGFLSSLTRFFSRLRQDVEEVVDIVEEVGEDLGMGHRQRAVSPSSYDEFTSILDSDRTQTAQEIRTHLIRGGIEQNPGPVKSNKKDDIDEQVARFIHKVRHYDSQMMLDLLVRTKVNSKGSAYDRALIEAIEEYTDEVLASERLPSYEEWTSFGMTPETPMAPRDGPFPSMTTTETVSDSHSALDFLFKRGELPQGQPAEGPAPPAPGEELNNLDLALRRGEPPGHWRTNRRRLAGPGRLAHFRGVSPYVPPFNECDILEEFQGPVYGPEGCADMVPRQGPLNSMPGWSLQSQSSSCKETYIAPCYNEREIWLTENKRLMPNKFIGKKTFFNTTLFRTLHNWVCNYFPRLERHVFRWEHKTCNVGTPDDRRPHSEKTVALAVADQSNVFHLRIEFYSSIFGLLIEEAKWIKLMHKVLPALLVPLTILAERAGRNLVAGRYARSFMYSCLYSVLSLVSISLYLRTNLNGLLFGRDSLTYEPMLVNVALARESMRKLPALSYEAWGQVRTGMARTIHVNRMDASLGDEAAGVSLAAYHEYLFAHQSSLDWPSPPVPFVMPTQETSPGF